MLRKYAPLIIAMSLIALVATACIITKRPPPGQTSQPVMVEKHKKDKDHHDNGKHKGDKHDH